MDQIENTQVELNFTPEIYESLNIAAKWSKFLAILGFVLLGIVLLLFFISSVTAAFNPSPYSTNSRVVSIFLSFLPFLFYLLISVIYYIPLSYLFRFSVRTKNALISNEQIKISSAFKNLKSYYKFLGIATIASFILFVLFFVLNIIAKFVF